MTTTKDATLSVRLTKEDKSSLEAASVLHRSSPGTLAAGYITEGVRRSRYPAIDFRDGHPGRVAYLAGTRWPVWLIVDLVADCGGDAAAAAKRVRRPAALVRMAVRYAGDYREEIAAARELAQARESESAA